MTTINSDSTRASYGLLSLARYTRMWSGCALVCLALATPAQAGPQPAPGVDARLGRDAHESPVLPSQDVLAEVSKLRNSIPDLTVRHSPKTGGVNSIFSLSQPLTRGSNDSPAKIALRYLDNNRQMFSLEQGDLQESRISRQYQSSASGLTHITVQQQLAGLDVFGSTINISITPDGRVLKMGGELTRGLQRDRLARAPLIDAADAVGIAANHARLQNIYQSNNNGLVYFPVSTGQFRLAWDLLIEDGDTPFVYHSVVDAINGEVLYQYNTTTMDHFPAHGLVYSNDGPQPSTPGSTIAGLVARDDLDFSGAGVFPHDDVHYDWWAGGPRTTTSSNNVIAREDRDGDNETTLGFQPTAMAGEDFSFVLDLSQDPGVEDLTTQNQSSAIVNLFHRNNWLHDVLYQLGFDEASGNFQTNNFGLGGTGGDPVLADAQNNVDNINMPNAGDNLCNAFFNGCQADGNNPRMTMLLCDNDSPLRDGDLDNSVIIHEFGHGVHHRLVPSTCNGGHQGMGEGWADYFAIALLAESDDDINGIYGVGHWLANTGAGGIRRQAYSTDQSVFTRTYADITDGARCTLGVCSGNTQSCGNDGDCPGGETCGSKPTCAFHNDCDMPPQAFDLGDCKPETHNTGELWTEALWLARANMVIKYGFNVGGLTMNRLVVEGMKLTDPDPTFLDARDGILQADLALNAGVNQCLLWDAFARMGMGYSAQTLGENDINPLEGFDTPSGCTPNIDVNADLYFGNVCGDDIATTHLEVFNTGSGDLIISSIERTAGSDEISLDEIPNLPLAIAAGGHVDFTLRCDGITAGAKTATFTIASNDADEPTLDLEFSCNTPEPDLNLSIANSGNFGNVCPGSQNDLNLNLLNAGQCDLTVTGINLNPIGSNYELPANTQYPLVLGPGADFDIPVRFKPNPGQACSNNSLRLATLTVLSDSPGENALEVDLKGLMPCPDLNVALANSGDFGAVCATEQADMNLTLFNQGLCNLTINSISSDNGLFELPADTQYPLVLSHDADFNLPVRFSPEQCSDDPVTGTLTIDNDSPGEEMLEVGVSGAIPCPNLVIDAAGLTGDFAFPATVVDGDGSLGCYSERSTNLRNTGDCPLTIADISAAGNDFTVMGPSIFPIVLPPGEETLAVTVRFTPESGGDPLMPDETLGTLTVDSDDPDASGEAELCGEGVVQSGIRTLVTDITSGLPLIVDSVDSMTVRSKGKKTPSPINLMFTDVEPLNTTVCGNEVHWHLNLETLPATATTGQAGKSQYETNAKEGNLQDNRSFPLGQCEFSEFQLQLKASDGGGSCLLLEKGEACTSAAECCSGKCTGKSGAKTCK